MEPTEVTPERIVSASAANDVTLTPVELPTTGPVADQKDDANPLASRPTVWKVNLNGFDTLVVQLSPAAMIVRSDRRLNTAGEEVDDSTFTADYLAANTVNSRIYGIKAVIADVDTEPVARIEYEILTGAGLTDQQLAQELHMAYTGIVASHGILAREASEIRQHL